MLIPVSDEAFDLSAQVSHRGQRTAADGTLRDQTKPTLNPD